MKKIYFAFTFFVLLFAANTSNAQCSAAFTYTVNGGTVSFVPSVPTPFGFYYWDFGNSATLSGQYATYSYAAAGTYNVCLILIDTLSPCSDTFCTPVTVAVGCNNLYVATTSTGESAPSACDGSATATVYGGTSPYAYQWSNAATTANVTNLCAGSYSVTVTDSNGCITSNGASVTSPPTCIAGFGANISGLTATLYNTSNDTTNATFNWSYGDNTYGTGVFGGNHVYASAGTYTVTLIMNSSFLACTDTFSAPVTVGGPNSCSAYFSMMQDSFNLLQWYIYPTVTGQGPLTYLWDFGDMTTSTLPFPNHTYSSPGQYTICLTVTDANACTSAYCDSSSVQRSAASLQMQYVTAVNPLSIAAPASFAASIFPNPATESLNLVFNQQSEGIVRLTDVSGKTVYEQSFSGKNLSVDVSGLAQGVYNCAVSGEAINWNQKVVVIH